MKKIKYKDLSYEDIYKHYISDFSKLANYINFNILSLVKKIVFSKLKEEENKTIYKNLGLDKEEKVALKAGYLVKELKHNIKADSNKNNIIDEVYLTDDMLRQHIQVVGTTGSGKTVWLKALLEQQIARGGGAFTVFGKADNKMLQEIQYAAAKYGREQDLFIVDWTATEEDLALQKKKYNKEIITNSVNFFELGDEDAVLNVFLNIAKISKKGDSWNQAAKSFLQALIKFLYKLEKLELIFNIEKIDLILKTDDKLKEIQKNRENLNYYFLREMITDKRAIFKLLAIYDDIYVKNSKAIIEKLKIKGIKYTNTLDEKYRFDRELIAILKQQVKDDVDNIIQTIKNQKNTNIIDEIEEKTASKQSNFYKLDVSISQFDSILNFYNKFALVLKNKDSDINLIDAVVSGKLIVFNLPGQSENDAQDISQFFMSLIETLIKKRGKQEAFDLTYLLVMDEINSWAARDEGKIGIGNILSVARGLGIGCIVAYQSDLSGLDKEKREIEQINSNVNTTILLKTQSVAIKDYFNKKVKKRVEYIKEQKIRRSKNENDIAFQKEEKEFFEEGDLEELASGEGYILKNGTAHKFITEYLGEDRFYENFDECVDLAKTINLIDLKRQIS